jgi:hypothetical protein
VQVPIAHEFVRPPRADFSRCDFLPITVLILRVMVTPVWPFAMPVRHAAIVVSSFALFDERRSWPFELLLSSRDYD